MVRFVNFFLRFEIFRDVRGCCVRNPLFHTHDENYLVQCACDNGEIHEMCHRNKCTPLIGSRDL